MTRTCRFVAALIVAALAAFPAAAAAHGAFAVASPGLADSRAPVNPVFGTEGVGGPPPQVAGPGPWQSWGGPGW